MRKSGACLLALLLASCAPRTAPPAAPEPHRDAALEGQLRELAAKVDGDVGIYVHHFPSGRTAEFHADELFPTASMIKVPIMLATYQAIHDGRLAFDSILTYTDSLDYDDEADILVMAEDSTRIALGRLVMLMLTMSDNTASLWLQSLSGTGVAINEWLSSHGFDSTRMNSRTPGRRDNWEQYGWGQTTPREMAGLLMMIRKGEAVSPAASEEMYRALTRTYWNGIAISQLPPWVQAASKQGSVSQSRSEVVLVNAPSGDYVFCVITRNQQDTSSEPGNEGYVLIRAVSKLLWETFEPGDDWEPAEGAERYRE